MSLQVSNLAEGTDDFTGNVWCVKNGETVLIDVGTGDCWRHIRELDTVDKVFITHSHYDHVDNLPKVDDRFNPEIYAFEPENLPVDSRRVKDGEKVEICSLDFRVIHTPGHKDDSICIYSPDRKVLFAGDLIFPQGGFGRTDLEEGYREILIQSIEKIAKRDVGEMYCGHDPASTENVNEDIEKSLEQARKREPKY
ncbi:MAG: MBL fold metallo-hydrolase [Candidatus Nanohaloarchaea archaeon]